MNVNIKEYWGKYKTIFLIIFSILLVTCLGTVSTGRVFYNVSENDNLTMIRTAEDNKLKQNRQVELRKELDAIRVVYDGLTIDQLAAKLDRNLGGLTGQGKLIAEYSLQKGVDPYLAVAIMLHETGCKYSCSGLTRQCNNVGGQKGSPSCGSSGYQTFPTLEAGIKAMIDNLARNYISIGLNTPEKINPKYAESKTWATRINSYISVIKAS